MSEALAQLHPQCATKLLKDCVCTAPAYLAQVCHPSITKALWLQILGGVGGDSPGACTLSIERSRMSSLEWCGSTVVGKNCRFCLVHLRRLLHCSGRQ